MRSVNMALKGVPPSRRGPWDCIVLAQFAGAKYLSPLVTRCPPIAVDVQEGVCLACPAAPCLLPMTVPGLAAADSPIAPFSRDSKSAGLGLGSQDGEGDDLRSKTAPDGERLPDVVRNVSEAVHHEDKVKSMYAAPAQRNPAVHRRSMDMSRAMAQERASGGADADRRSNVDGRSKNFGHMEPRSTLGAEEHEHQQPAQREAHRSLPGYRDSADPGSRGSTSSGETGIQRRASMLGEGRGRLRPLPQGGAEHRSSTASGEIPRQVSVGSRRRSLDRPSDPPR